MLCTVPKRVWMLPQKVSKANQTSDLRPKTQDPRPKTQDPRPKTQDPRPPPVGPARPRTYTIVPLITGGDGTMKSQSVFLLFSFWALCGLAAQQAKPAPAQASQRPPSLDAPEVHSDNSVTFRFLAPNAQEVKLAREGAEQV